MAAGIKKGEILRGTASQHGAVFPLNDVESADAGADVDAHALGIFRRDLQSGGFHGFLRGGEREVDKAAHLARFFFLNENGGSKFLTSAANVTEKPVVSKAVMGAIPLSPANRWLQTSLAVLPTPQIRPMPVTTTRRFKTSCRLYRSF